MNNPYVYHDRKMMKWIPFNALLEQSEYLTDLLHGRTRIEKPVLSPDQFDELNYQLETALTFDYEVVAYYFQNGEIKEHCGKITRTDAYEKKLYFGDFELPVLSIVKIELH